jgi:hypothetical protein
MTEQDELIQEIRQRVREAPNGSVIDSLVWANKFAETYSGATVPEIIEMIRKEARAAGVNCS